uniref:Glycoprotein endo-alpha-1,2-mannosidase n=1 Tax=Thelazia callipaeda TaxID=103827 RepID=A0A0N5CPW9_THECL
MVLGSSFLMRWLFLVALAASVFAAFHLVYTQGRQDPIFASYLRSHDISAQFILQIVFIRKSRFSHNPKLGLRNKMKNDSVAEQSFSLMKIKPTITTQSLPESEHEYSVQIFYYPWYGNPKFDKKYYHWNHNYLPHWNPEVSRKYTKGFHVPPSDIGSNFYPLLGPYSSRDPNVIEQHMKWMSSAGVDVVVVSWYPPRIADEQGHSWDDLMPVLLDAVGKYRMKLSFHMEPYKNRNGSSIRADIEYIIDNYGSHSALFKMKQPKQRKNVNKSEQKGELFEVKNLPVLYFYDSYLVPSAEWKALTTQNGKFSVRGGKYDILFIGLLVKSEDRHTLLKAGFDGIYTYFATEGFSYGSTPSNWPSLSSFCRKNNLLFVPSVGPGYDDRRVRPWNEKNLRNRENGKYYAEMFEMAHIARANIVTITSFNEWHEGTQIEPAIPFTDNGTGFVYSTYAQGPEQYLHETLDHVKKYFTPLDKIAPEKIVSVV